MPRKVPQSAKKHKEILQEKRAVKRGDVDPATLPPKPKNKRNRGTAPVVPASSQAATARKLQSTFSSFSSAFLQQTKVVAANAPLSRPIPATAALYPTTTVRMPAEAEVELNKKLKCMKRPKWRYEMSKKQVLHTIWQCSCMSYGDYVARSNTKRRANSRNGLHNPTQWWRNG